LPSLVIWLRRFFEIGLSSGNTNRRTAENPIHATAVGVGNSRSLLWTCFTEILGSTPILSASLVLMFLILLILLMSDHLYLSVQSHHSSVKSSLPRAHSYFKRLFHKSFSTVDCLPSRTTTRIGSSVLIIFHRATPSERGICCARVLVRLSVWVTSRKCPKTAINKNDHANNARHSSFLLPKILAKFYWSYSQQGTKHRWVRLKSAIFD